MTTLDELCTALDDASLVPAGAGEVVVDDVVHDSRQVRPGTLFVALRGQVSDGHDHVASAAQAGAAAAMVEETMEVDLPLLVVADTRRSAGPVAAVVHGRPSHDLQVVATTGTNGKTTVSHLVEAAVAAGGRGTGLLGTIATRVHGTVQPAVRTTPEGTDLQRILADMRGRGVQVVAMEVSSHGLALHRVDGIRADVAVFTNLSQDHLDFHDDLEDYFDAKARLFTPELAERGIVGTFDQWGRRLAEQAGIDVVTVGRADRGPGDGDPADVVVTPVEATLHGTRGVLRGPAELLGGEAEVELRTRLAGGFNLHNAAQAFLAAVAVGTDAQSALDGIAAADHVPGRVEVVVEDDVTALVDYAHTPDAIAALVETLRPITPGRVVLVVGAGGDRDRHKRGPMGRAATAADVVVLTSDNPRTEPPQAILDDLLAGAVEARSGSHVEAMVDREAAIDRALTLASTGDVVVVAGKGHETGQDLGTVVRPFDDRDVLRRRWARLRGRR